MKHLDATHADELTAWLLSQHGAHLATRDLVAAPYGSTPEIASSAADDTASGLHRAVTRRSMFTFVASATAPVEVFAITRQSPSSGHRTRRATLRWLVNGQTVGPTTRLGQGWSRETFKVPASALRSGLNTLEIAWPPPPVRHDAAAHAARALRMGRVPSLYPGFGELAALRARQHTTAVQIDSRIGDGGRHRPFDRFLQPRRCSPSRTFPR